MEKHRQPEEKELPSVDEEQAAAQGEAGQSAVAPESREQKPEELTMMLEDARAKADEHWDQLVRSKAEVDNLRKRHERELANAHKYALEGFVQELLPVKDSMELGLSAALDDNADVAKLREGTELMVKMMTSALEKFNVVEIDPDGEPFDPKLHQAMSIQERDDVAPNTVVTVVQKGYTLNGRLVRPAMVMVSKTPADSVDREA
jgi:molecular chaperone GrpE